MNRIIDKIKKITSSNENTQQLLSVFNSINPFSIPIIRFFIETGTFVVRQRINPTGKFFTNISELSYPPKNCCLGYGRANIPNHPMFYCCSFPSDHNAPEPRYTTLLETSTFIHEKESRGIERSTFSRWDVIKRLNLIALPFSTQYERTFDDIIQIQEAWEKELTTVPVNKEALELVEYMSNEMASDVVNGIDHFKTAYFVCYLLYVNDKTKDADGIIYPSVAAGEGFNIALKPDVADNKLKFTIASLCYLVKDNMEATLYGVNHSIGFSSNGELIFIPDEDFDINVCTGFNFIN